MSDEDEPSQHLLALFAAWWTSPEGSADEDQLDDLFSTQAEREDFDPDELADELYERIREEQGKISLTVPIPPDEDESDEDDE